MAQLPTSPEEARKRKREIRVALLILAIFVASVFGQTILRDHDQGYGFFQSLLYFGLVHLNVIIIMLLVFLVSRNIIKAYLFRKSGRLGSTLRWRMVTSLVSFSLLPSLLLFVGSTYIIRQGFDQWFGGQVAGALGDAQEITRLHYRDIESNLGFYGRALESDFRADSNSKKLQSNLDELLERYPLEALEYYPGSVAAPLVAKGSEPDDLSRRQVPRAALESLQRALSGESFQLIRRIGASDLVQQYIPVDSVNGRGVLVLSKSVPFAMKTRMTELESAFLSFQKARSFKSTLKTNYTLVLLTLFALTLFVVSWFGLYVTKQVTEPVTDLMRATEEFRKGKWSYRIPTSHKMEEGKSFFNKEAPDLEILKAAFNLMGEEVGRRGQKLEKANHQLRLVIRELEERERYLETLLSSIRRGVLVLNPDGSISRINAEALEFGVDKGVDSPAGAQSFIGRDWRKVFKYLGTDEEAKGWLTQARHKSGESVDRIFEVARGVGRSLTMKSVRGTGILLKNEQDQELGWLIILEDVSDAARMERLNAWQEVTKRVAHEIKNPLTPVQISADRMLRRLDRNPDSVEEGEQVIYRECIGQIQKQVKVIRDLVREFSQFAKMPEPQFAKVDLTKLLDEIIADYRFTHPECELSIDNRLGDQILVTADPEHLRRLVVNLADNALHSMEEAKVQKPKFSVLLEELSGSDEGMLKVSFVDNGPGVSAALRQRIFDPYTTSKASGLGLGLPIVRRIAMEHRGRVSCQEAPYGLFVLELPRLVGNA